MSDNKGQQEEEQLENIEHVLSDSEKFIEKNQKMISNVIFGIIILVLAFMAYNRYIVAPKEMEAQSQIFAGEMLLEKDSFQTAIEGDGNFMGFEYIVNEYGSTTSGNLAKYYTGICYLHLGQYDEAITYLNKFDAEGEMMPAIKAGAIGDCHVEQGNYSKAISSFKKAASFDNTFTTPLYLKKCAIAYEQDKDYASAIDCYTQIKEDYPQSTEARDIEKYMSRATELAK